jgi:glycosyltransferase involved in cell wall biosynthesis
MTKIWQSGAVRPTVGRLRIDHVVASVDQPGNGVAEAVRGLAFAESDAGADVHVHAIGSGAEQPGIDIRRYRHANTPHPALLRSPDLRCGLLASVEAAGVIHAHNLWTMPVVYAAEAAEAAGCPLVCSPHGALNPRSLRVSRMKKLAVCLLSQRRALGRVDVFRATSQQEAVQIRAQGFPTPIAVVPNGVDVPAGSSAVRTDGPRRVGFLGRLHPIKAVDRLLEAWRGIAAERPEWQLCLCGPDGGVERELRTQAAGVPRVVFEPPVAPAYKAAWYATCDLVVLPSHGENFGMVVAEALAHGVPVVTSTGTPWRGVVEHGCGWWVPNEIESLRATLLAATGLARQSLHEMGDRGRDWMIRDFSWRSVAERMIAAYRWLLGSAAMPDGIMIG